MLQSPCGLLDWSSPSIYQTFKRQNFITHHELQCKQISDSQYLMCFELINEVMLFTMTIFVASCQTGGAQPKTGSAIAPHAPA